MRKKIMTLIYIFTMLFIITNFSFTSSATRATTQAINGNGDAEKGATVEVNGQISKTTAATQPTQPTSSSVPSTENVGGGVDDDLHTPDTGDTLKLAPYIVLLIIPVCVLLFIMKRRKEEEEKEIVCEHEENKINI